MLKLTIKCTGTSTGVGPEYLYIAFFGHSHKTKVSFSHLDAQYFVPLVAHMLCVDIQNGVLITQKKKKAKEGRKTKPTQQPYPLAS